MFVNLSNHPSEKWSDQQKGMFSGGHAIVDIPFPPVPASASMVEVHAMARDIVAAHFIDPARGWTDGRKNRVMVQGEFSLTIELTRMLQALGWECVVACSERNTVDNDDGTKTTRFEFVRFRILRG